MASAPREGLKQSLLLALVAVCVALVALTWVDNLRDPEPGAPGFVRGTRLAPVASVTWAPPAAASPTPSPLPTATPVVLEGAMPTPDE
jgi:hypothetical protein